MNKKTIIAFLAVAAVLICGIATAVFFLYRDVETVRTDSRSELKKERRISEKLSRTVSGESDVLRAVPSDAVGVCTFDTFQEAVEVFSDEKRLARLFVTSQGKYSLDKYLSSLLSDGIPEEMRNSRTAVSIHYGGNLSALLVVDCPHLSDSSASVVDMLSKAQVMGLRSKAVNAGGSTFLLVSSSEADIVSSLKHIDAKASVLDAKSFSRILAKEGRSSKIFLSCGAAGRVIPSLVASPYGKAAGFLSTLSEWISLDVSSIGNDTFQLSSALSKGVSYYENVLSELPSASCDLPGILPVNTISAVGLCLGDVAGYIASYSRYLDAHHSLQDSGKALKWAQDEGICEVAVSSWMFPDGTLGKVLLARTPKMVKSDGVPVPNDHAGYLGLLLGKAFELEDESVFARKGEWIVSGSVTSVKHIIASEESLYEAMGEMEVASMFPSRVNGPIVYMNLAEIPQDALKEPLLSGMKKSLEGVSFAPAVLSMQKGIWQLDVRRCSRLLPETSLSAPAIEISKGPFEVTNCGTGKKNLFYQNDNLYLCLKETTGKGLWGVSFDQPICGAVGQVDYYANGKIQFLFCAGSSLYLIDRLGRFCSGFPVNLGKSVLLGPAVYDFSGAKKYNVMVLHTDNTIEMYNLQGQKPSSWKGITCPDTITALPVLKRTSSGQKYWEVSTSDKTYTYDFWGGESQKIK